MTRIKFCGAARTVTGSRHLIELDKAKILVDCGMFQGDRELRERNWVPFPIPPHEIDAAVITHAHHDHIGYLPRLVKEGYRGPIYATKATVALCQISLPDSGRLQEEDARHRNKHGITRHQPALPLYTESDAYACLKQFKVVGYHQLNDLPGKCSWRYLPAGHILGSAFAEIYFPNGERILMSGDLGRYDTPIIIDPWKVDFAEYLVVESTYGDRIHSDEDPEEKLAQILRETFDAGGTVIIPSFAIGRTQEILFYLKRLQKVGKMPRMPIFVDSPMASSTTRIYQKAAVEHDPESKLLFEADDDPMEPEGLSFVRDREESKAINVRKGPMIVIAGSGMANGGRVVHHLAQRLGRPETTVLFVGYQAEGTLGREILEKKPEVSILGRPVPVQARVEKLNALSAHADQAELMKWLGGFKTPPKRTFIVHGEPPAQEALRSRIGADLGWKVEIPEHLQEFELA